METTNNSTENKDLKMMKQINDLINLNASAQYKKIKEENRIGI